LYRPMVYSSLPHPNIEQPLGKHPLSADYTRDGIAGLARQPKMERLPERLRSGTAVVDESERGTVRDLSTRPPGDSPGRTPSLKRLVRSRSRDRAARQSGVRVRRHRGRWTVLPLDADVPRSLFYGVRPQSRQRTPRRRCGATPTVVVVVLWLPQAGHSGPEWAVCSWPQSWHSTS
jgi:hypothetical protein